MKCEPIQNKLTHNARPNVVTTPRPISGVKVVMDDVLRFGDTYTHGSRLEGVLVRISDQV